MTRIKTTTGAPRGRQYYKFAHKSYTVNRRVELRCALDRSLADKSECVMACDIDHSKKYSQHEVILQVLFRDIDIDNLVIITA